MDLDLAKILYDYVALTAKADDNAADYAYVPHEKKPGSWKLPINDAEHVKLAIQAITEGLEGSKVEIPENAIGKVKSRIRSAIKKTISDKSEKAYYTKWLDSGKKPNGAPGDYTGKANVVSDDGDPFEPDDYVVTYGDPDSPYPDGYGGMCIAIIRSVNGNSAMVEMLDADMKPTGKLVQRGLLELSEYNIYGEDAPAKEDSSTQTTGINAGAPEMPAKAASTALLYDNIDVDDYTTTIKALDDDRFGGYAVLWGSPAAKDLTDEYFTADTDLGLELHASPDLPSVHIPSLYHHALDKKMSTALIGTIDTVEPDDIGLWAEGQWNKRFKYLGKVKELVSKGALGYSSGSMPHHVEKARDGHIKKWPIWEISMTPTPAEPRGTDVVAFSRRDPATKHYGGASAIATAYKALNLDVPTAIKSYLQDTTESASQHSSASNKQPAGQGAASKNNRLYLKTSEGSTVELTQEQLDAQIAVAIKAAEDKKNAEITAKAAEDARVEARVLEMVKAKLAEGSAKTLPVSQDATQGKEAPKQPRITGMTSLKYANLSSEDMSYMADMMVAYANGGLHRKRQDERTQLEQFAIRWVNEVTNDQDKKLEREISAKAIREVATKRLPDQMIDALPYKSMDDVFANDYDKTANDLAVKANELDNTGQSSFGLEWIPTIWNNQLWRRVRISNPYASNLMTIEMPSNPFKLPVESTDPTVFFVAEGTDSAMLVLGAGNSMPLSKIGSGAPTITAKKQAVRVGWSTELLEDSVLIPVVSYYRYQAQRVLQNFIDDTIVNGDLNGGASVNVNLIDGTPAAGTSYLAFDGLRKYALVTNSTTQAFTFGGGAPTLPLMRSMRKSLAKQYAVDLPNLAFVMSFEAYMKALNMPEFENWNQLGAAGSNVTGLLPGGSSDTVAETPRPVGFVDGIPVFVSAQIALANTAGMISATPANNTTGTITLHHKSRWVIGYRRNITLEIVPLGYFSDTYQLWATVRYAIVPFDTQSAVVGYNIAV